MNIKFASLILAIAFAATACKDPDRSSSGQQDLNDRLLNVDFTPTPTATVPPPFVGFGLEAEPIAELSPYPTETPYPSIDTGFQPIPLPWFDEPNWRWLPLTLP